MGSHNKMNAYTIHIYIYVHIYMYAHLHIACICMCIYTYIHIDIHTYIYIYVGTKGLTNSRMSYHPQTYGARLKDGINDQEVGLLHAHLGLGTLSQGVGFYTKYARLM